MACCGLHLLGLKSKHRQEVFHSISLLYVSILVFQPPTRSSPDHPKCETELLALREYVVLYMMISTATPNVAASILPLGACLCVHTHLEGLQISHRHLPASVNFRRGQP